MAEERTYCKIDEVTPVANKVQRAQSILGRMAMKKVKFPKVSAWTQKAIDELLKFPNSRHDDFVDTIAWIGMGLDRIVTPGGYRSKKDKMPEVGTMAWVKWDSEQQKKHDLIHNSTGGW